MTFQEIVEAARVRDHTLSSRLNSQPVDVLSTIRLPSGAVITITPAGLLASYREYDAAMWLHDHFAADITDIATGLILAGCFSDAFNLVQRCNGNISIIKGIYLNFLYPELKRDPVATLACFTTPLTTEDCNQLLQNAAAAADEHLLYALLLPPHNADRRYAIMGAAISGRSWIVEHLLLPPNDTQENYGLAIQYAAMGNHFELVSFLLSKFPALIGSAFRGAAICGNRELISKLAQIANSNLVQVVLGAAIGGHAELLDEYLQQDVSNVNRVLKLFIEENFKEKQILWLLSKPSADVNHAIMHAAGVNNKQLLNLLIPKSAVGFQHAVYAASGRENYDLVSELIKEYETIHGSKHLGYSLAAMWGVVGAKRGNFISNDAQLLNWLTILSRSEETLNYIINGCHGEFAQHFAGFVLNQSTFDDARVLIKFIEDGIPYRSNNQVGYWLAMLSLQVDAKHSNAAALGSALKWVQHDLKTSHAERNIPASLSFLDFVRKKVAPTIRAYMLTMNRLEQGNLGTHRSRSRQLPPTHVYLRDEILRLHPIPEKKHFRDKLPPGIFIDTQKAFSLLFSKQEN